MGYLVKILTKPVTGVAGAQDAKCIMTLHEPPPVSYGGCDVRASGV